MTSELKPGRHICEFVTAGPKNYVYKTVDAMTSEQKSVQSEGNNVKLQCLATIEFR